jgi:predicted permease
LGIEPYLGRFFHASDEHGPNSAPYVVLTYAYWHSHFLDDRGVVGRTVQLNKRPFTVVGVTPPDFHGTLLFFSPSFFVPKVNQEQVDGQSSLNARGNRTIDSGVFMVMGHLNAGVTPAEAVADLNSIGADLEKTYPKDDDKLRFILARPGLYGDFFARPAEAFLLGLMLLAGLILLAACANLGSLFAARAADRSREIALRLALGSSRSRVLRGLFTEAMLISLAGGAAGLLGSVALLRRLSVWQPIPRIPIYMAVNPDASVYALAFGLALVSGVLFGIVPVRQTLRTDPYQIVRTGSAGALGSRITLRDLLLGAQIAICGVLVTSSLVAERGLARSLHSNLGFEPQNAMLIDTVLNAAGYYGDAVLVMQRRMAEAMEKIPGVTAAGLIGPWPPLVNGSNVNTPVFTVGTTDLRSSNAAASAVFYSASFEIFSRGRYCLTVGNTRHDDENAPRVAVVNQEFVRWLFGSVANAVGGYYKIRDGAYTGGWRCRRWRISDPHRRSAAGDVLSSSAVAIQGAFLVVRSNGDTRELAGAMPNTMRDLDRGLPANIQTWSQALELALFPSHMAAAALGLLGAMGAMLSVTGIFGLAAYSVSKRKRELGIRMALGARRREVLQAALGRAFKLLGFGSAAGLILGVLASRVLAAIVYSAIPGDPLVLAGAIGAVLLLGLLATWIPAQRALSLDPARLLREE